MAPVVCVAVPQRLGRSLMDKGSWGKHFQTDEPRGGSRAEIRILEIACEIDLHLVATTAEVGLNNYV